MAAKAEDQTAYRWSTATPSEQVAASFGVPLGSADGKPYSAGTTMTPGWLKQATNAERYSNPAAWIQDKNPKEKLALQQQLMAAGLYPPKANVRRGYWTPVDSTALGTAFAAANANGQTVEEALAQLADGADPSGGSGGSGPSTGTAVSTNSTTNTTRQVNLTGLGEAKRLLEAEMQKQLGRAGTAGDYKRFVRELNKAERANPATSVTRSNTSNVTTTTDDGKVNGDSVSSSTSSSSNDSTSTPSKVDPGMSAEDFATDLHPDERNAYQRVLLLDVLNDMMEG